MIICTSCDLVFSVDWNLDAEGQQRIKSGEEVICFCPRCGSENLDYETMKDVL